MISSKMRIDFITSPAVLPEKQLSEEIYQLFTRKQKKKENVMQRDMEFELKMMKGTLEKPLQFNCSNAVNFKLPKSR